MAKHTDMKKLNNKRPIFIVLVAAFFLLAVFGIVQQAHATRFFRQPNTWYEKIPNNPKILAGSSNYVV
jgi:hypothetical protein